MAINKQSMPYEFLARWDPQTGVFKGAHIQFYDTVLEDGVVLSAAPSRAYGVGEGLAFPLADIINQITVDAVSGVSAKDTELAAVKKNRDDLQAEKAALIAEKAGLASERDAVKASLAAIAAELRDLKHPPTLVRYGHLRKAIAALDIAKRWDTAIVATEAALTTAGDKDPKRLVAWWESDSPAAINSIGPDWAVIMQVIKFPAGTTEATLKAKIAEVQAAAAQPA
jgi:hypothetical protein